MPNNISEQQKKQAALYICNALSITSKRKFEQELKTNSELGDYVNELKSTIDTTREISTIGPSEEFLQGSRNLLRGKIQVISNKKTTVSVLSTILDKIKHGITSIAQTRQPVWAVATYVIIGLLAGRLLLSSGNNKPINISGQEQVDMNKLIQSGVLSDIKIDQSTLSPTSIKLVSHTDDRFNVSGNVNDHNIRQILYYLLLNDDNTDNRYKAGQLVNRITPNNEVRSVLISSVLSESDQRVRLQSMETLTQYQSSTELINACKRILLDDHNYEMRLEALNILEKNKSSNLIPLLEVVSKMDDNSKVRVKARELLTDLRKPVSIENNEVTQ
ncbi:HEAT repeat domain-containing protein [bacterium]|nr:HEAT repeat domain-containing protein [bacterium]